MYYTRLLQVDDFTCDKDFISLTKHVRTFLFIVFLFCAPNHLKRMFQSEGHILIMKIVYIFVAHKWNIDSSYDRTTLFLNKISYLIFQRVLFVIIELSIFHKNSYFWKYIEWYKNHY